MDISNKLFIAAKAAQNNAYAPYSQFKVGAAVYCDDSQIYNGCNVENASYPCGTCAEAGAIASAIAHGAKKITEILIIADSKILIKPCGACLQRIAEFGGAETLIHLASSKGIQKTLTLKDLLPEAFLPEELNK